VARLAIRTLLLVCAALPAAGTTNLGVQGDAIEIVDFYARATLVLPSGVTQANAEVRGGTVLPGPITLHLRIKRHSGKGQSVEWRMYRVPENPNAFDTGLRAVPIQANGDATASTPAAVHYGAYQFRAVADPHNRFRETPRTRANNERFIILVVAQQPPSN
jgi:hypothetical protein